MQAEPIEHFMLPGQCDGVIDRQAVGHDRRVRDNSVLHRSDDAAVPGQRDAKIVGHHIARGEVVLVKRLYRLGDRVVRVAVALEDAALLRRPWHIADFQSVATNSPSPRPEMSNFSDLEIASLCVVACVVGVLE